MTIFRWTASCLVGRISSGEWLLLRWRKRARLQLARLKTSSKVTNLDNAAAQAKVIKAVTDGTGGGGGVGLTKLTMG